MLKNFSSHAQHLTFAILFACQLICVDGNRHAYYHMDRGEETNSSKTEQAMKKFRIISPTLQNPVTNNTNKRFGRVGKHLFGQDDAVPSVLLDNTDSNANSLNSKKFKPSPYNDDDYPRVDPPDSTNPPSKSNTSDIILTTTTTSVKPYNTEEDRTFNFMYILYALLIIMSIIALIWGYLVWKNHHQPNVRRRETLESGTQVTQVAGAGANKGYKTAKK
ncbi:uncharacterized protein LOC132192990 [Neocloeon triangulifer]|uniref:uncharacterized protein LOC132192990 n=1 Tax=Neocloeon triangulifer TaxID=2078957 RepID=UPI00286EDB41|nr:uncharacterized protein LOC132192990 [Neocloeon triangulifer]